MREVQLLILCVGSYENSLGLWGNWCYRNVHFSYKPLSKWLLKEWSSRCYLRSFKNSPCLLLSKNWKTVNSMDSKGVWAWMVVGLLLTLICLVRSSLFSSFGSLIDHTQGSGGHSLWRNIVVFFSWLSGVENPHSRMIYGWCAQT